MKFMEDIWNSGSSSVAAQNPDGFTRGITCVVAVERNYRKTNKTHVDVRQWRLHVRYDSSSGSSGTTNRRRGEARRYSSVPLVRGFLRLPVMCS